MHIKGDLAGSAGWVECILQAVKDKEAVFESRSEGAVTGGPRAEHSRQRMDGTEALEWDQAEQVRRKERDFPGAPVAKTLSSQCRGLGSIPGQETRYHMSQQEFTCRN